MLWSDPFGSSCLHCIIIGLYHVCLLSDNLCLNGGNVSLFPSEVITSQASGQIYVLAFLPLGMKLG